MTSDQKESRKLLTELFEYVAQKSYSKVSWRKMADAKSHFCIPMSMRKPCYTIALDLFVLRF